MTGPMNLISAPARELTPASRRSGAEAGRPSVEAAPQRAFEQALDSAREHSQPPKCQTDSGDSTGSTSSAGGASAEASPPIEPTTSRQTGLAAVFAAAWSPVTELSGSTTQKENTAAVIDLDLVGGMAAPSESATSAKPSSEAAVAETASDETTDGGAPVMVSALGESVRAASAGPEHTATPDELGTDADQVTQRSHPAVPAAPVAQVGPDGEVVISGEPVGEESPPHRGENVTSDAPARSEQMPGGAPAVDGEQAGVYVEQLAEQMQPASSSSQARAVASLQSAQNSSNAAYTKLSEGAAASASALQVALRQVREVAPVQGPVRTGNVEGSATGSAHALTLHISDVTMPINHTPDTGVKAGVTAETPLAPAGSAPTTAPTLVSGSMGQSGGIPPTAAPAPAAAPQPTAPAAAPLQVQLAGPIAQLATGPAGEKILTVNVAPENLGPVTVRANISGDAMRIELFAPQEAGREALRGMLTELRRDLAGLGLGSSQVSLGEGDPPSSSSGQPRGDAQMGERSRDPAAGQQPAEDSGSRDQQRGPNAEQVLDQLSGAPAVSRLVGSALLPEAPHPVGLDLLA